MRTSIPRVRSTVCSAILLVLLIATSAFADKATVAIDAPASVKKGTEITIKIKVTHSGNNFIHHVDWAKLSLDGKEQKRWEFSWRSTPEANNFEREFKYVVTAPVEVLAQADCNIHGSNGVVKKQIQVTE